MVWLRSGEAEVEVVAEGFWATRFRVRQGDGFLKAFVEPEDVTARWYGNPILFPFPLTVQDGRFVHRGRSYQLPTVDGRSPSHGVVRDHGWELSRATEREVTGTFVCDDAALFPFPFRLVASYALSGSELRLAMQATNIGSEPMPFGAAIHPYIPLEGRDQVITADGAQVARFADRETVVGFEEVPSRIDLRRSSRLADLLGVNHMGNRSEIYVTYVDFDRPGFSWRLEDSFTFDVTTSEDFRTMVHWAPPGAPLISPVISTSLSNGFNLREAGYRSGIAELAPGESWNGWARMAVALG